MIPILYDKYETDFLSNGLGQLGDCLTCTVTEEINGIYELAFTYPMSGAYYEQLINYGGVVACTHDHNGDIQLFDIYKYDAPIDGIVTFYGSHVSYRLAHYLRGGIDGPAAYVPADLFDRWNNDTVRMLFYPEASSFVFHDYTGYEAEPSRGALVTTHPYAVRAAMFGTPEDNIYSIVSSDAVYLGSLMRLWPGEWKFDRFNVEYYKQRGQDRGVQIRYGKNMTAVERERAAGGIISVIFPRWGSAPVAGSQYEPVYSPYMEHTVSPWISDGEQMYSNNEVMYLCPADLRAVVLDVTDQFEEQPTQKQVNAYCLDYMSKGSTWRANDNITVEFLDLYGTADYKGIEGLSNCLCGDYVSILYPQLGIVSDGVEIMSLTDDVLAERVIQMQLNTIRTTLAQVIIDSIGGAK